MNIKKLLLGGIAGGIAFFLLGWLIFGMLLMDFMSNHPGTAGNLQREEPEFLYLALGNLLFGLMFAYIFIKGNVQSFGGGLITGGIIGALMSAGFNCVMYGTSTITSKTAMAADVGGMTLMCALAGAVIGMVLGMGNKKP
jgi:hypothetical protein